MHNPIAGKTSDTKPFGWLRADTVIEEVLAGYDAQQQQEDALTAVLMPQEVDRRRDEFLLSVGRATGVLLNLLARESGARSILELGTAFGYSTIWLAEAACATGGCVLTIDVVGSKQEYARAALKRAGLLDYVEFQTGDAMQFLASTRTMYDLVLLDLWKDLYIPCVDRLLNRLHPEATIVADNMFKPAAVRFAAAKYQAHIDKIPSLQTVLLPVGSGLAISRYHATRFGR